MFNDLPVFGVCGWSGSGKTALLEKCSAVASRTRTARSGGQARRAWHYARIAGKGQPTTFCTGRRFIACSRRVGLTVQRSRWLSFSGDSCVMPCTSCLTTTTRSPRSRSNGRTLSSNAVLPEPLHRKLQKQADRKHDSGSHKSRTASRRFSM